MSLEDLKQLPDEVKEFVFSKDISDYNKQITDQFFFNQDQVDFILNLEKQIFLKKIPSLELLQELGNLERAKHYDLRKVAMEIAYKIFWPLQEYLGDVDRLILRLGGKIPRLKRLHKKAVQNPVAPDYVKGNIKSLMEEYPDFKTSRLSSKKIIDKENRKVTPTVDNWLKDYVHLVGAGYHNSLQRAKYLAKSPNILALSEAEKKNLRHFFNSYDDGLAVEIDNSDVVLKIKPAEKQAEAEAGKVASLEAILNNFHQQLLDLSKKIIASDFLLSEADNSLYNLRTILWQAIGLPDQDKAISCLKVLIEKKALDLMIKEDKRFISILRRFIGIKFGETVVDSLGDNNDKLLLRRLFLELVLHDKLHLSNEQATIAAYYLTNLHVDTGQVVYLDQQDQKLKWRELQVVNNNLVWIENI